MTLLNLNHKTRNIDRTEQEHKLIQRLRKQEDSATQESTTQLSSLNNWFSDYWDGFYKQTNKQTNSYWAALSLSFRLISILLFMNIKAWGPQVNKQVWCVVLILLPKLY